MRNPINIENITHKGKSGENQNPNGNVNFERFKNANQQMKTRCNKESNVTNEDNKDVS